MNILLVSASFENEWRSSVINANSHYPLGLGYIHCVLENNGHKVQTLFLNDTPFNDCFQTVKKTLKFCAPEIVGFNILTNNRVSTFKLMKYIHTHYPKIKIIIGGIHTSVMCRQIVNKYPYCVAVIGEGEITTPKLIEKLLTSTSLHTVDGIVYKKGHKVIQTNERELITDLDVLPFPKHEIFFSPERTMANILTSRGCPNNCSFCVLDVISRRRHRKRSIENVIAEIRELVDKFPRLESVWIHDDQFFLDNQRVIKFCQEIVRWKIKLRFICSGRFKPVSAKMVRWLQKAGFMQVLFGLESGSERILRLCHKNITQKDVISTIQLFKKTHIFVVMFLITGLIGETDESIRETYEFVKKVQRIKYVFYHDISILTVYPGTEVYEKAKKAGIINDAYWLTDKPTPLYTVEHSSKKLMAMKNETLDHIALFRIHTIKGFMGQFDMIPAIMKFIVDYFIMLPVVWRHFIQRFFPKQYLKYRQVAQLIRAN